MAEKATQSEPVIGEDYTTRLKSWVDRLKSGDESALDELLTSFQNRLLRLARKMLKDFPKVHQREETSDVLNNSLFRLSRALRAMIVDGRIASDGTFHTRDLFCLGAEQLRRELLDLAKHYRHGVAAATGAGTGERSEIAEKGELSDGGTHDSHRLAEWTEFHRQIDALPNELREVFDLLFYQELTQAEAALVLGVSDRTVKKRWQDARLKLHEILGGRIPGARSI
jgi:RNA polymerase sigma factor (sigma-70 family)